MRIAPRMRQLMRGLVGVGIVRHNRPRLGGNEL
jgi:hypothetical protein